MPAEKPPRRWMSLDTRWPWMALGAITIAAAILRLRGLGGVAEDPFYDAAVRSMARSWHNFFFGAYEPGGSVSIDKPPLDLWLQVISVKVLGFTPTALKLPQALAGSAAVPLVYAAVRRPFGPAAGLMASLVLAVLPISVLTARSDTMDTVMMALTLGAFVLVMHAGRTGRVAWLYLAAVTLGLAFNVKLLEALIAVPALLVAAWLGLGHTARWRLGHLGGAAVVFVVVALSWLTATLAFPAAERPFAIGSTNGSAWNAAFVFNGYDRIAKPARQDQVHRAPGVGARSPGRPGGGHRHPPATTTSLKALDHLPILPPSATRLLQRSGPLSGRRLGFTLLGALLLGLAALAVAARRPPAPRSDDASEALRSAAAWSLGLWLVSGTVLFSVMTRLHPRYVEAFTPAVAAVAGIGLVWAARHAMAVRWPDRARSRPEPEAGGTTVDTNAATAESRWAAAALTLTMIVLTVHARYLYGTTNGVVALTALAGAACVVSVLITARRRRSPGAGTLRWPVAGALAVVAALTVPVSESLSIVHHRASDAGHVGFMPAGQLKRLSAYLRSHQGAAYYEVAVTSATQAASLVVRDARPVLVLTTYDGLVVVPVARLAQLVAQGRVGYALLGANCHPGDPRTLAQCSPPGRWIRAHGVDVSAQAGLHRGSLLWRLSAGRPTR
ncbi:MAG TPA: glycosyltransferase family 39 protein [Solirubrobacteraceae bacterium]|jgi:4-amino-4-deoxy-L-arabinose transferase-like glycosyltransferase|nr:glycosyltransferase family 39 protein [Solirubrobacteraceae bacterium]